jgi:hypothetical protein
MILGKHDTKGFKIEKKNEPDPGTYETSKAKDYLTSLSPSNKFAKVR